MDHQHGCNGHHDLWEVSCASYKLIQAGNKHNPWKCFSPDSETGYHRFENKLYDQCANRGCERTRGQLDAFWGVS